ncbi:MAG TPA: ABC transporter ATP-binding protein, partial [Chloroflexota bacterium]|nr:ABC transporter ATP-binding protein [Chloroflexota bacterium]
MASPRLIERQEIQFFATLHKADLPLAVAWWALLVLRGVLPTAFAISTGVLIGAVQRHSSLTGPLVFAGAVFVLLQTLAPIHTAVSANLGDRTAAWLYDRMAAACVRLPGMGHLENPKLANDLSMARDFDLGITAPPLSLSMDFIAQGLIDLIGGATLTILLAAYAWWAALLLGAAWISTHWLLRESGVWRDRNTEEVRGAQRESDYAYRLAVTPEPAKELRLFGLADWTVDRFITRRRRLFDLQYRATRLREQSLIWSVLLVGGVNVLVFWSLGNAAADSHISLAQVIVYAQAAIGASLIAFGGLNWALDGSAAPVAAVARLVTAMAPTPGTPGYLESGPHAADGMPALDIRCKDLSFSYPGSTVPVLEGLNLTIPAGTSLAIVGQNGAGKTTLAKLLCRLYDPTGGAIEIDGHDLKQLDLDQWRSRLTAVFQDFIRFELPLRNNVAPAGAPDDVVIQALNEAGASDFGDLDAVLARGYTGGIELSGGQWQRIALARALCAVELGAGLILLDEPTAQLDVRGEAEIFRRVLEATRGRTTILISHRFSTVRQADKICVVEHGRVIELGSHQELMALGGRYR